MNKSTTNKSEVVNFIISQNLIIGETEKAVLIQFSGMKAFWLAKKFAHSQGDFILKMSIGITNDDNEYKLVNCNSEKVLGKTLINLLKQNPEHFVLVEKKEKKENTKASNADSLSDL